MKHLDVVDGELAAVPVEERPAEGIIGQNIELVILRLRSPDADVWTASTATAAAAGLGSTKYQGYILLSNGLIQRTPCDCTLTDEALSLHSRKTRPATQYGSQVTCGKGGHY